MGVAIETGAERRQQQRRQHQDADHPEPAFLRRGKGGADHQQQDGQSPGQVHPMRQADRHHHQTGADQRGNELPGLARQLNIIRIHPGEISLRRQHAQAQHQHPAQPNRAGRGGDREIRLAPPADRLNRCQAADVTQQAVAAQQDLVAGEQGAGEEQRDHIVIEPEHEDRADDVRRAEVGLQAEQDRGVEHADAARQIGGQPGGVGGDIDAEEDQPGQPRRLRQQRVEDRCRHRDVDGREQHLHDRHAPARAVRSSARRSGSA